jgi:hypothetical protein
MRRSNIHTERQDLKDYYEMKISYKPRYKNYRGMNNVTKKFIIGRWDYKIRLYKISVLLTHFVELLLNV